jgi:hypothetical protein
MFAPRRRGKQVRKLSGLLAVGRLANFAFSSTPFASLPGGKQSRRWLLGIRANDLLGAY